MKFGREFGLLVLILIGLTGDFVRAQEQQQAQGNNRATLVISQNANGSIRIVDQNNNSQVIQTSGRLQATDDEQETDLDDQVVGGLLEWLEEKKRKKKEKKEKKKEREEEKKRPLVKPEKKEIHIHINNTINKKEHQQKKKHEHGHKHYEDYHDGHYSGGHGDKHYSGKHSWPLLSHHHFGDYYGGHYGGHGHGAGDHDDYSGYESQIRKKVVAQGKAKRRAVKSIK